MSKKLSVECLFQTESYMTFTVRANFYVDSMNYLVSDAACISLDWSSVLI